MRLQKPSDIPTRLSTTRPPVEIAESLSSTRFPRLWLARQVLAWLAPLVWLWSRGRLTDEINAQRARRLFERMGGLWVKTGQLLAMRRDLFSDTLCDELSQLQDHTRGFAPELARRIIEQDLGAPVEELFARFDPTPFAAASIGQIHDATLPNGLRVAVKVQRPNIAASFRRDLLLIQLIVRFFETIHFLPHLRWGEMLWELQGTLGDELDYRLEATSIQRMRRSLRSHKVYVPKVFSKYCSARVLVMEFIQGVFMSDYIKVGLTDPARLKAWCAENRIDARKVGRRLYFSHCRQVFEDNLFHCDLHPGNILLTRDSRVALIDFGSVGSFEKTLIQKYKMLFEAISQREYAKVSDMFVLLGPPLPPNINTEDVKADVVRWMRSWEQRAETKSLPYHQKSLANCVSGITRILMKYKIPATWEFMRMNRAGVTLDASLVYLLPKVNFVKIAGEYSEKGRKRAAKKASKPRRAAEGLASALLNAATIPRTLQEHLFFEGEWLRRRAKTFQASTGKFAYLATAIANLVSAALFLGTALAINLVLHMYFPTLHADHLGRGGQWMTERFDELPAWVGLLSTGITPLLLYVFIVNIGVKRRFASKEVQPTPER